MSDSIDELRAIDRLSAEVDTEDMRICSHSSLVHARSARQYYAYNTVCISIYTACTKILSMLYVQKGVRSN